MLSSLARRLRKNWNRLKRDARWMARRGWLRRQLNHPPAPPVDDDRETVLFFAPEAGITAHFKTTCLMARSLQERGYRVMVARCHDLFSYCPVIGMHRLADGDLKGRHKVCLRCADASFSMLEKYGLEAVELRYFDDDDLRTELSEVLKSAPENLLEFSYEGVEFGKLCAVDLVLVSKVHELEYVAPEVHRQWLRYIESSLLAYLLAGRLCESLPIHRLVYHNDYSVMMGGRLAAEKRGIPVHGMTLAYHHNIDHRRVVTFPAAWPVYSQQVAGQWPRWRELPLPPDRVEEIADDLTVRTGGGGTYSYSPAKDLQQNDVRRQLNLDPQRKLLVAFTSSLDELVASKRLLEALGNQGTEKLVPFADQVEWLAALTEYVAASDDLQLVVRVHPREGANQRDATVSQHLPLLEERFRENLSPHCHFVWPTDTISSYDLGEAADLVLTSWSTIGVEMARLGAPVLAAFEVAEAPYPNDDFLSYAPTREGYFQLLRQRLGQPLPLEATLRAFRWYNLFNLEVALDFSDVVPEPDYTGLPPYQTPVAADAVESVIIEGRSLLDLQHRRLCESQCDDAVRKERVAMQRQMRRVIHYLFTGQATTDDYPLRIVEGNNNTDSESGMQRDNERTIVIRGGEVEYRMTEGSYARYSPMIARLARLCCCANSIVEPIGEAA